MKRSNSNFLFTVIFLCTLFFNTAYTSGESGKSGDTGFPNPYIKQYPFKTVVIEYKGKTEYGHQDMEKKTYDGTETVYIKGYKFKKVLDMSAPSPDGKSTKIQRLQIIDPDFAYYIDLIDKTGIKVDNSMKYGRAEYLKLNNDEKKEFHQRMERRGIISLDLLDLGKKTGTDVILGRQCDVYEYGEKPTQEKYLEAVQAGVNPPYYRKTWIWRDANIPLKSITEQMSSISELRATKIEENVDIPNDKFNVPAGIKITYDEKMSEASKQEALARFMLYKTGKAMTYRVKADKQVTVPKKKAPNPGAGN